MKQFVKTKMVSDHTGELCLKIEDMKSGPPVSQKTMNMQQEKPKTTIIFHENHIYFFLHTQTASDINPIVKKIHIRP